MSKQDFRYMDKVKIGDVSKRKDIVIVKKHPFSVSPMSIYNEGEEIPACNLSNCYGRVIQVRNGIITVRISLCDKCIETTFNPEELHHNNY